MSQSPDPTREEPPTSWTLVGQAHDPAAAPEARDRARRELVCRYLGVARRYLAKALRRGPNPGEAVEDLVQEFSVRVMRGALHNASAGRGRFRAYLQTVLCNLVRDHRRQQGRQPEALGGREPEAPGEPEAEAAQFREAWHEELLKKALGALADFERQTGQVLYSVLRLKMEQPDKDAPELAAAFTRRFGRPVTAAWVRKRLHLARGKLRELLVREVRFSLPEGAPEEAVREELAELDLLRHWPEPDRGVPKEGGLQRPDGGPEARE